jgi:hypothetical protein
VNARDSRAASMPAESPTLKIVVAASASCTFHHRHTLVGRRALHCTALHRTEKRTGRHLSLGGVSHERKIVRPRHQLHSRIRNRSAPHIFAARSAEQQRATVRSTLGERTPSSVVTMARVCA